LNVHVFNLNNKVNIKRLSQKYSTVFSEDLLKKFTYLITLKANIKFISATYSDQLFKTNNEVFIFCDGYNEAISIMEELKLDNYLIYNYLFNYFKKCNNLSILNNTLRLLNNNFEDFKILGILNITPDSFSDGGSFFDPESAFIQAELMIKYGVDIIDIGGESSRPGTYEINEEEEINRTIPIINKILSEYPDTIISIDTKKSKVAECAIRNGVKIVNDISAFNYDVKMLEVLNTYKPVYVLMHMKGIPLNMQINPVYDDPVLEIVQFFEEKISILKNNGINNIILDPGIGFGKRLEDNFEILNRLDEFLILGYPILIGLSRKQFLGITTGADVKKRDIETIIMETLAVNNGASFIRTHNYENCYKLKQLTNNYKHYSQW